MEKYQIVSNYISFEKLDTDSIGTNFRAGEIKDKRAENHCILTEVHPFLTTPPTIWKRVKALLEGIKNQNIPGLYSHEKIIEEGEKALVVYPYLNGKSLEQILDDAHKTNTPMELELVLAIVFGIADVLDSSSAIKINKMNTFHGILTPDNVMVDFDGKISLRNYGIYPYLDNAPGLLKQGAQRFMPMLAPELIRDKSLTAQADIYHLGNIIHRLLIGNYFQYSPGEDFDAYISSIDLDEHIMLPQEDFAPKIIELFKRALNPDPAKRFVNIKKMKEFISTHFHIEELSSSTFMLAYFMNLLYKKTIEESEKLLAEELAYTVPDKKLVQREPRALVKTKIDDHVLEDLLIELEHQKRSKIKIIIPFIIILVVIIGIASYVFIKQQKEAQLQLQQQIRERQEFENRVAQMKNELKDEYLKRLKTIEQQAATTEEEKREQAEEIETLKQWRADQEQHQQQIIKAREEALQRQKEEKKVIAAAKTPPPSETVVDQKPEIKTTTEPVKPETTPAKDIQTPKAIQVGDIISLDAITFSPSKLTGSRKYSADDIGLPANILQKYQGQNLSILSDILVTEFGSVSDAKIKGNLPQELQAKVTEILKTWTYIPGEKDKIKVKVWIPAELTIAFATITAAATEPVQPAKVDVTKVSNIVPLNSATYRPSKVSGDRSVDADKLDLPKDISNTYKGRTITVNADLLIDELGSVLTVNIAGNWPPQLKTEVADIFKTWKYIAGEKDKVKVKIWLPAKIAVAFGGSAETAAVTAPPATTPAASAKEEKVDSAKLTNVVPLNEVTYRPSKVSGSRGIDADKLNLPKSIKSNYKGQTITINADVLIDEFGGVLLVNIKQDLANELKFAAANALKEWRFIPAEKDKVKVKVWYPARITISFK